MSTTARLDSQINKVAYLSAIVLFVFHQNGSLAWHNSGRETDMLLMLAGPLTVLPLLAFAFAARRIPLSTLGILQYIGPTMQFGCAIYYGEKFTTAHAWCFGFIWLGVGVFAFEAIRKSRLSVQVPASLTENQ